MFNNLIAPVLRELQEKKRRQQITEGNGKIH